MTLAVGNDCKLYYNSGTAASPTWVLIEYVGDVSVDVNISTAEIDLRLSAWVTGLPAKLSGGFNFNLARDIGGTVHDALRGFALARTIKQYASASGSIASSGTQYFKSPAHFTASPWQQNTQEIGQADCQLGLSFLVESSVLIDPAWATIP